jgi:hypothetical protein
MYLVDTNVWLERLLDQERSPEVGQFLERTPPERLSLTDFSFHSIGIILTRLRQASTLVNFVRDIFLDGGVLLVHLEPEDIPSLLHIMERYQLDFDDAYQYLAVEKHHL